MIKTVGAARYAVLLGVLLLLLMPGLVLGLASAIASSPSASPSAGKAVLRVGWIMDPDNLNPFIGTNATGALIRSLNYDVLVGLDAATLAPTKGADATGLATGWDASADGRTWTFDLRSDAAWQDGEGSVTATDVAFTYRYVIENEMAVFTPYTAGIERVRAIDDDTVEIRCAQPKADMLLAAGMVPILPEHIWSKIPAKVAAASYPNKPPVVGSGPFQCVELRKGVYARMVANRTYWRAAPQIDEVLFEFYTNADSMGSDLKVGAIDACYQLQYATLKALESSPDITTRKISVNGYDDLVMNCYEPPAGGRSLGNPVLRDPRFREALQWAIDKEKLAQVVYFGQSRPGDTVITPHYFTDPDWHWSPPEGEAYTFDLARAGELLDEAGYRDSNGDGFRDSRGKPIELRLWGMSEYPTSQAEVKLVAGWLRQIGLRLDLQSMPMASMYDRIFNTVDGVLVPDFDLCQSGIYLGLDPGQNLSVFTTAQIGAWNDSGFSSQEFDRLYDEQGRTINATQRKQLTDRMQQIVYEQSPYVVLAYFGDTEAWTDKWTGWVTSPRDSGSAIMCADSYLFVRPASSVASTVEQGGPGMLGAVIAVAAASGVVGFVVWRRRRGRSEERE